MESILDRSSSHHSAIEAQIYLTHVHWRNRCSSNFSSVSQSTHVVEVICTPRAASPLFEGSRLSTALQPRKLTLIGTQLFQKCLYAITGNENSSQMRLREPTAKFPELSPNHRQLSAALVIFTYWSINLQHDSSIFSESDNLVQTRTIIGFENARTNLMENKGLRFVFAFSNLIIVLI
ncbi:hypothetical protein LXL04_001007 [Taraxacum kok-saghyz]